jgi:Protein of unknown function (DUF3386)
MNNEPVRRLTMRKIILSILCLTPLSVATLGQTSGATTQLGPETRKADPVARNLLKQTRETRYYFPPQFVGFTSDVVINDNGKIARAVINYDVGGGADLQFKGGEVDETSPWTLEAVLNIIRHRRSSDFESRDGRYPICFAEDDKVPAGRRVAVDDAMKSSYRIFDGRVTEVDRTLGDERFIISVLEEVPAGQGRYLPRHFTVSYFNAKTGELKHTDTYTDEYHQVDGLWFPASERIVRAESGKVITRIIAFQNPRIRLAQTPHSQEIKQ